MPAGKERSPDDTDTGEPSSLPRRLAWFVALWAGGVLALGAVGLLIRSVLL